MAIDILHFIHLWFEDQEFYRVMVAARETLFVTTASSYVDIRAFRKQNLKYLRTARRKLQTWSRRLARAVMQTNRIIYFCEPPDSQTKVTLSLPLGPYSRSVHPLFIDCDPFEQHTETYQ